MDAWILRRCLRIATIAVLLGACNPTSGSPAPTEQPPIDVPSAEPTPGATVSPGETIGASPAATTAETTTVRAYFVLGSFVDNAGLVPVLREVPRTTAVGAAAMQALLDGPNDEELGARPAMYTNIPAGTRFLGLTIDRGVATVNLSTEFGAGGDSASDLGLLAQVVYTLTQVPTITSVSFQIEGVPMTVFDRNGVTFDGPVGRDDYTDELPAIFVDRPAWRGVLGSPARLVGLANVFEATFRVEILDATRQTLASAPVTASCGSGCWGTFDVSVTYHVGAAGWGTLRVFEPSAKAGSTTTTTEYPVWLTP